MWKLTIEDDEGQITPLPLFRDHYLIGRGEENTVRLTERNISRRHATLTKIDGGWTLYDTSSHNGSYVNGVRVVSDYRLSHGDVVQMGDYRLICEDEEVLRQAQQSSANPPPRATTFKPDRLVVVIGPKPGQEFPIHTTRLTIGRSVEADICLPHSSVSRIHAEISALGGGRYEILDKESSNGVGVNGSFLRRGLLEAGDYIELGEVKLKFVGAGQIYRPGPEAVQLPLPMEPQTSTARPPPISQVRAALAADDLSPPRRGALAKHAVWGALLGVAVVGSLVLVRRARTPQVPPVAAVASAPAPADPALASLAEAQALAEKGSLAEAHERIAAVVTKNSAMQDHAAVRELEGRWADGVLVRAEQEQDPNARRTLLSAVVQCPTVDTFRRKQASDRLREFDVVGTDVHDLPRSANPTPTVAAAAVPAAAPGNVEREPPAPKVNRPVLAPNPYVSQPAAPADVHATGDSAPINELMLQGKEGQARARAELEARVNSGKASVDEIKKLRALCRHAKDRACQDKAGALLSSREARY